MIRLLLIVSVIFAAQSIALYRARYRPAAELVPIARSGLGSGGEVTLDARTATLILNGSPAAIQRAVSLLERVDRPLRQVVVETDVRQVEDLESMGVRVAWKASLGPVSIGTLPVGANGLRVGVEAARSRETTSASARVRLLEGSTGIVRTGTALPVLFEPYWGTTATTFVPVDTGFEVLARVLENDQVFLELRPFAGRVEDSGELTYIAVATSVTVSPGETIVLAETMRSAQSSSTDLSGARVDERRRQEIVLLSVELEP